MCLKVKKKLAISPFFNLCQFCSCVLSVLGQNNKYIVEFFNISAVCSGFLERQVSLLLFLFIHNEIN